MSWTGRSTIKRSKRVTYNARGATFNIGRVRVTHESADQEMVASV